MIKIKFISKQQGNIEEFEDEAYVSSLDPKTVEQDIKNAINEFNEEETKRYGKKAKQREFVCLTDNPTINAHEWHKCNIYGMGSKSGTHDLWKCSNCGLKVEVYALDSVPRGGDCFPERTCACCSFVAKNENFLKRHLESKRHISAFKRS